MSKLSKVEALKLAHEFQQALRVFASDGDTSARSTANRLSAPVSELFDICGVSRFMRVSPPPMIGGYVQEIDIIANWSGDYFLVPLIGYAIDQTDSLIGAIESGMYENSLAVPAVQSKAEPLPAPILNIEAFARKRGKTWASTLLLLPFGMLGYGGWLISREMWNQVESHAFIVVGLVGLAAEYARIWNKRSLLAVVEDFVTDRVIKSIRKAQ